MAKTAHRATRSAQGLQTCFELRNGSVFAGSVADPARPTERFTVELLVDGLVITAAYADQYTPRSEINKVGDGCHGFTFQIPQAVIENAVVAEARVANLGIAVGSPVFLEPWREKSTPATDHFRWLGGLRFSGWVADESRKVVHLTVAVDGTQVLQIRASVLRPHGALRNETRPEPPERRLRFAGAIAPDRRWLDEMIAGSVTGAQKWQCAKTVRSGRVSSSHDSQTHSRCRMDAPHLHCPAPFPFR
jgi:hypothetical protein